MVNLRIVGRSTASPPCGRWETGTAEAKEKQQLARETARGEQGTVACRR
jgi:hypothetical protein